MQTGLRLHLSITSASIADSLLVADGEHIGSKPAQPRDLTNAPGTKRSPVVSTCGVSVLQDLDVLRQPSAACNALKVLKTTVLKRLASAVQLRPWPPCFQSLASIVNLNSVPLCPKKSACHGVCLNTLLLKLNANLTGHFGWCYRQRVSAEIRRPSFSEVEHWQISSFATMRSSVRSRLAPPNFNHLQTHTFNLGPLLVQNRRLAGRLSHAVSRCGEWLDL
jgi:hypothetical protein